jgi:putative hydrolase of the HAD superfamily
MPQLKLITFDLDNTLWDVEQIIRKAEADMIEWIKTHATDAVAHYQQDALASYREEVVLAHPGKRHDLSFMRIEVLNKVMLATGYRHDEARRLAQDAFDVFFAGRNRVEFFPGALELLDRLQERFVLYALTNGNADIQRTGLDSYLSGAFSAADVGASKPHGAMFNAALAAVDSRPHEAIHVGDHLVDDIEGAHDAGMHTVWVNLRDHDPASANRAPTETVTDLDQIDDAIERIERL